MSGNGGRKLVSLENGWLIAANRNGSTGMIYISKDNGGSFTLLCSTSTGFCDSSISVATNKNQVYLTGCQNATSTKVAFYSLSPISMTMGSTLGTPVTLEAQTTLGGISSIVNPLGTEIHVTWSSKNTSYAGSFNIRYIKGMIDASNNVVWGTVEQVVKNGNTTMDSMNPSITLDKDGVPTILFEMKTFHFTDTASASINANSSGIGITKKTKELVGNASGFFDTNWSYKSVYLVSVTSHAQSSPSAIFVPQNVNGLANGRIWVAWHGKDATDIAINNLRISYSDDNGVTWSAMQKLTSGNVVNEQNPSMTFNKDNIGFIVFEEVVSATDIKVKKVSYNGTWGSPVVAKALVTSTNTSPSTLFDLSLNFNEPLFIYRDAQNAKVGFYGTWTVTTISVIQGSIGQKTDKANLLTYAITTDGVMSTITEKVNGVTIGTKTATSGQSQIVGLTQAQWDAVKFGKYKDITGGLNTLVVTMGVETYTYTFDKRPLTDITSVTKAVTDSQSIYLPAVKSKLANAIRSAGGAANDTDAFEMLINNVRGIELGKKTASGSFGVLNVSNGLVINNLTFVPSLVVIFGRFVSASDVNRFQWRQIIANPTNNYLPTGTYDVFEFDYNDSNYSETHGASKRTDNNGTWDIILTNNGFTLGLYYGDGAGTEGVWVAIE
jgi:hypothetical protein